MGFPFICAYGSIFDIKFPIITPASQAGDGPWKWVRKTWPITMETFLLDKGLLMCGGVLVWGDMCLWQHCLYG